ncbi:MAG: carbon starvation CstA 5TM domain-containing protein [Planctomycetota bacterium]
MDKTKAYRKGIVFSYSICALSYNCCYLFFALRHDRCDASSRVAPADPPPPPAPKPTFLTNKYLATLLAVTTAFALALLPAPGSAWSWSSAGGGGLILWPMFGATNQLLGGLAFLVIAFYLLRRRKPIWFIVPPLLFMLVMPAWALVIQLKQWLASDQPNHVLIAIALATLALEAWMITEAARLYLKHRAQSRHPPSPVS